MILEEHIYSVLVVSSAEKFNNSISHLLPPSRFFPIVLAGNAAQARRKALEKSFDIIIINSPLTDENGTELALDLSTGGAGIMLLVRGENYAEMSSSVVDFGVLCISKPTNSAVFNQSITLLCATRRRLSLIEQKATSIEKKIEEIRLINRAKWLLIEKEKMTEKEAHRFIEKSAMDRCVTKSEISNEILDRYGK